MFYMNQTVPRHNSLKKEEARGIKLTSVIDEKISEFFGQNVFGKEAMKEYLSEFVFETISEGRSSENKMDFKTTEAVAEGLKKWAMDRGVTHFTHWFQPLTGGTGEKHDAFFKPSRNGNGIEELTGSELLRQEPDASSFPSGGLRSTYEARGYSIWDPSSPAFFVESKTGKILYIPALFISFSGESLDYKAPLLKSIEAVNTAATSVYHYFDKEVKGIFPSLGWEQEYFVMDADLFAARPDLLLTGRTLFGNKSAKDQEQDDHYFGVIPERVQQFIHEFEREALKLGIPVLTRHNEVAPNQFECAPMYEELNVANDHNMLLMDLMKRVSKRHRLQVLLHEKPFAGINGSGKHNNWSMSTDTGKNVFDAGKQPENNLPFITFFVNTLMAVNQHSDLLRASVALAGNDHRLGANEAPPAIMSVFTGAQIENMLNEFEKNGLAEFKLQNVPNFKLDLPNIPTVILDDSDRNRTSPFPFIGNRFEFRAVGSTQNCAFPMTVLNTMVADQLVKFKKEVDAKIAAGGKKTPAIVAVLQEYIRRSKNIIFNGDGYSIGWQKEAEKRGLGNVKATPYALEAYLSPKAQELFASNNVLTERELTARYQVFQDLYVNKLKTEADLVRELSLTHILPSVVSYQLKLLRLLEGYRREKLSDATVALKKLIEEITVCSTEMQFTISKLENAMTVLHSKKTTAEEAKYLSNTIKPYLDVIRKCADLLEGKVEDACWNLPKYRDLLFI
jgi:glutamine synthetase